MPDNSGIDCQKVITLYLLVALALCIILSGISYWYTGLMNSDIKKITDTSILRDMIGWCLQRQISWGVTTLTFSTLFFMILLQMFKEDDQKSDSANFLFITGLFFLCLGLTSAFMIPYYYREVSYLESAAGVPIVRNWLYEGIFNYYIVEISLSAGVALLLLVHVLEHARETTGAE